jgi:hypothetical protein
MYIYPVLLPAFSNREDFLLTLSLFDDDTGDPINLSGTSLAQAGAFAGNTWVVTVGAVVTASVTPLTIPTYPIGNQLNVLALTVGLGLAIVPGSPVTIRDNIVPGNAMTGYVLSYVPATGRLTCQIGLTFQFEIRSQGRNDGFGFADDYASFFDWGGGTPGGPAPLLSASLGAGINHIDLGFLQIMIAESQMRQLRNKTYLAAMTMTDSVNTRQAFVGKLPTQYGGVIN